MSFNSRDSLSREPSPLNNYRQLSTGTSQQAPSTARPTKRASKSPSKARPPKAVPQSPPKASSPKKAARAPSIEVSDDDVESVEPYVPDLKRNPIMDLDDEDEAAMSGNEDEDEKSGSQAEEGEELSGVASSEGEGETIVTEEDEEDEEMENSSDMDALEDDDEEDEDEDEDDGQTRKYVFEPLSHPKSNKPSSKPKGKEIPETIEISSDEEESFDVDQAPDTNSDEGSEDPLSSPTLKTKKGAVSRASKGKAKPVSVAKSRTGASKPGAGVAVSKNSKKVTEEDIDELASKVDKTKLSAKPVRKSARATTGK